MVTGCGAPGVMKKKTSCHMKGNIYKYICNLQKREELSHLADQDIQRKFGV